MVFMLDAVCPGCAGSLKTLDISFVDFIARNINEVVLPWFSYKGE